MRAVRCPAWATSAGLDRSRRVSPARVPETSVAEDSRQRSFRRHHPVPFLLLSDGNNAARNSSIEPVGGLIIIAGRAGICRLVPRAHRHQVKGMRDEKFPANTLASAGRPVAQPLRLRPSIPVDAISRALEKSRSQRCMAPAKSDFSDNGVNLAMCDGCRHCAAGAEWGERRWLIF